MRDTHTKATRAAHNLRSVSVSAFSVRHCLSLLLAKAALHQLGDDNGRDGRHEAQHQSRQRVAHEQELKVNNVDTAAVVESVPGGGGGEGAGGCEGCKQPTEV